MRTRIRIPLRSATSINWWPVLAALAIVLLGALIFAALYKVPRLVSGLGILLVQGEMTQIISPKPATLEAWLVEEGAKIKAGQAIALLRSHEASFELIELRAPKSGFLAEIIAYAGTELSRGQSLALLTPEGDTRRHLELVGFVSSLEGKKISVGMKAHVWPSITSSYHDGALLASVKQVGKLPLAKAAVQSIIKIPELAKYIRNRIEAEPFLVILALEKDEQSLSGYRWSGAGPAFELDSGVIADFDIIYDEPSLLALLWPALRRFSREQGP